MAVMRFCFSLPLGVIGKQCSVIAVIPGYILYYKPYLISLPICAVWSVFVVFIRNFASLASQNASRKDYDQTVQLLGESALRYAFLRYGSYNIEPAHDKTYNKTCVTNNDSDQSVRLDFFKLTGAPKAQDSWFKVYTTSHQRRCKLESIYIHWQRHISAILQKSYTICLRLSLPSLERQH